MKQVYVKSGSWRKSMIMVATIMFLAVAIAFLNHTKRAVTAEERIEPQPASWNPESKIVDRKLAVPWINVADGREIVTAFVGADGLPKSFESSQNRPLSLATADFDADGMPDIVAGYERGSGGLAVLMRGNVDALFPNAPEALARKASGGFSDASFVGPARLFEVSAAPDFLAAGDFDADGNFDIALASRTENTLFLLRGKGNGSFQSATTVELPGNVTALIADDFNRRDGLNDLIVAVQVDGKGQLLVFEHPYGALKAEPEVFDFPAPVTSLSTYLIGGSSYLELAIAAGNELGILRGRDRMLMIDQTGRSAEAAQLTRTPFGFEIEALAAGDFVKSAERRSEIALFGRNGRIHLLENITDSPGERSVGLDWQEREAVLLPPDATRAERPTMLTARVSARSIDTLAIGLGNRIYLFSSDFLFPRSAYDVVDYDRQSFKLMTTLDADAPVSAILPLRLNIDSLSDLVVMREGSIAPAVVMTAPNVTFNVESASSTPDGDLTDGACRTEPCLAGVCTGPCTYRAAREQLQAFGGSNAITFGIQSSGVPTIVAEYPALTSPLVIDGSTQPGGFVEIRGVSPGNSAVFGAFPGNSVFRGLVVNGYTASGGHFRLESDNNIVEGCRIGTNSSGTAVAPIVATVGIEIANFSNNLVGGTTPAARNVISLGTSPGINIANIGGNRVQGNFIGTDITGNVALGNHEAGVTISGPNTLGGTTAGAGNLISGTTYAGQPYGNGVQMVSGGGGALVQGNFIGTNVSGTAALPNQNFGIGTGSFADTIGGTSPTARNLISGNGTNGILLSNSAANPTNIIGNFIGTNAGGTGALPNGGWGMYIEGTGRFTIRNNLISANLLGGAQLLNNGVGSGDLFSENFVGIDVNGTARLGNGGPGLLLSGYFGNIIRGNTIAANSGHGIDAHDAVSMTFEDNFIGTNALSSQTLGNVGDGIAFRNQSRFNQFGNPGAGNVVAHNLGHGISFGGITSENDIEHNTINNNGADGISLSETPAGNRFRNNSIFGNTGLGIDLDDDGVTVNDNCDLDFGSNFLQNYPEISSVRFTGNGFRVNGLINSAPDRNYVLNFYGSPSADASGYGEGQRFLGTTTVAVPAGCQVGFSANLPVAIGNTRCVTATATDPDGNTSELSRCVANPIIINDFDGDGIADISIFRPSNGQWWFLRSSDGQIPAATFGESSDRITPGDFTGDGISDIAIWRPSTGNWFVMRSEDGSFFSFPFGIAGDIPAPGDFDGDGIFDAAVFRSSDSTWYIRQSSGGVTIRQFGSNGDKPVVADYDGDGISDIAIFRPSVGEWWFRRSSDGAILAVQFGASTDTPVPGDFTGDGKADIAFWRPSNGFWFILRSEDASFYSFPFGSQGDIPVPADYDGDGKFDSGVFRPTGSTWYLNRSDAGILILGFGLPSDRPVASAYIQ